MGMALRIAIVACLKYHVYSYKGKLYRQGRKGVIGLDLERCICNKFIYIGEWLKDLVIKLKKIQDNSDIEKLKLELKKKGIYVDDHFGIHSATPMGAKYNKRLKKVEIKEDQLKIDAELEDDKRTANLILDIANTLDSYIQMKAEVSSDHPELGNCLPILDTQV